MQKKKRKERVCPKKTGEVRVEGEEKSVVICGRGRRGSQACPKERKLRGPQFRSFSSSYPILSFSLSLSFSTSNVSWLIRPTDFESSVRLPVRQGMGTYACACARACCTLVEATHFATSPRPLTFSLSILWDTRTTRLRDRARPMLRTETQIYSTIWVKSRREF